MTVACRPIPSYHIFPSVTSGQDPLLHTHTFSLCHMWAVQVHCWLLGCSVVGQGWPESCSTSKWRLVEIKISQSAILARTAKEKKIWNSLNHLIHPSPHLSWKCSWTGTSLSTCVPAFLWHKAKGRGWFGAGGAGPVGQGCTLLQPLLLYKEKKKNNLGMVVLMAGRRSGGREGLGTTYACTERGRRLQWWTLWHQHYSETLWCCCCTHTESGHSCIASTNPLGDITQVWLCTWKEPGWFPCLFSDPYNEHHFPGEMTCWYAFHSCLEWLTAHI